MQSMVRDFCRYVVSAPTAPAKPELREAELRARLIAEEAAETVAGLVGDEKAAEILTEQARFAHRPPRREPDIVEVVDGLCDLLYVVFGTAEAIGVELAPFFERVHAANMRKLNRPINEHGKRGWKPPGWADPKNVIRSLLEVARYDTLPGTNGEMP
jgi:predicted HAD superfamily Cof-like phosphohydrolase